MTEMPDAVTNLNSNTLKKHASDVHILMDSCLLAGQILMANGSEISRVEDVIQRMGAAADINNLQVYVLLNAITVSFPEQSITQMRSIPPRIQTMDMEKIVAVNDLTRQFTAHLISIETFSDKLSKIDMTIPRFSLKLQVMSAMIIAVTFVIMLTRNTAFINLFLAASTSGLAYAIAFQMRNKFHMRFFGLFLASLSMSFIMLICSKVLVHPFDADIVIIGAIMPFVPGVALTNAVREIMAGNFISGQGRIIEALLTAASVGLGIVILSFFY